MLFEDSPLQLEKYDNIGKKEKKKNSLPLVWIGICVTMQKKSDGKGRIS